MNMEHTEDVKNPAGAPSALNVGLGWQSIASAPKDGTIIRLRDEKRMYNCVMAWDKKRKLWTGMSYSMMGASKTYWDEEFCPIFEWQHVGA
jgi:hypothetical protein